MYSAERSREYKLRNPEKVKAGARRYYKEHAAEIKEKARLRYLADPEKYRAAGLVKAKRYMETEQYKEKRLQRLYGISITEHYDMWIEQLGLCAVCHQAKPLCVDHDHQTGEVRGLLCTYCNKAIGMFKDDEELLQDAIGYLVTTQKTRVRGFKWTRKHKFQPLCPVGMCRETG